MGDLKFPVFYMNYNLNPQANPWRDAIGSAVKTLKGAEFTISRPRDLFFAWTEIIGRIVKLKFGRTATASACARQISYAGFSYCVRHRFGRAPGSRPAVWGS